MNKKLILLFVFISSLALGFTACGDDDDDPVVTDHAKEVQGTYNGDLTVKIENAPDETVKKDIKLERTAENKVKVTLADFVYQELPIGNIVVDNIPVSKNGETYNLAETTTSLEIDLGEVLGKHTVGVKVKGTVKKVDGKDTLDLNIAVSDVPALENLDVVFSGSKK